MCDLEFLPRWYQARKRRQRIRALKARGAVGLILVSITVFSLKSMTTGRGVPAASRASWIRPPMPIKSSAPTGQAASGSPNPAPAGQDACATNNAHDALRKSDATQADQNSEQQHRLQNLRQQAAGLRLQSTVMGVTPKALVNGELLGEGEVVVCGSGKTRIAFRVLRIEARRIIVEREGIKLEIPMKSATMPQER
jgi:hypothetical protein